VTKVRIQRARVLELLGGDETLLAQLCEAELLPVDEAALTPAHTELARVAHTLAQELRVNAEGIEVILRMRAELIATRRQLAALLQLLRGEP
jgi:hypothetical protein